MSSSKLPALAFDVFRFLNENVPEIRGQNLLLACSGGLDSVVLLDVFLRLRSRFDFRLSVAHIHHGFSKDRDLQVSRDRAHDFVCSLAEKNEITFYDCFAGERELRSEADLRQFRLESLRELLREHAFDRVVLAHHADDLFETRLLRLIRGTGVQGLRAMSVSTSTALRPFLKFPKSRLRAHAESRNLEWVEDTSNANPNYLRNWLRQTWLPLLESRQPGSNAAMARSLDLLAGVEMAEVKPILSSFDRLQFHQRPLFEKQDQLARLGRTLAVRDFGKSKSR